MRNVEWPTQVTVASVRLFLSALPSFSTNGKSAVRVCNEQVCDRVCDLTNRGLGGFCSSTGICVCWR